MAVIASVCLSSGAGAQSQFDATPLTPSHSLLQPSPTGDSPSAPSLAVTTDLAEEIETLRQRLQAIEDRQATVAVAKEPARKSTQQWDVKLGGHIQMEYILWAKTDPAIADPLAENHFNYRRLRLVADGEGYDQFDFRLQITLEPGEGVNASPYASPDVKDAYITMKEIPLLGKMRLGNFFVPFSLEQVTNDTNNVFLERSIPTQNIFAADREVGIAFYNCTEEQNVTWTTGMFFDSLSDTVKTRFNSSQGYRLSGRLTWLPYYDAATNGRYLVHTGLGVLHTHDQNNLVRFAARPQIQRGPLLIDSGSLAARQYTTGGAELAVVWGPCTLQSEAFVSGVDQINGDNAQVGGAYAHLSYFLTGENRIFDRFGQHGAQFSRNRPHHNFATSSTNPGWGAWELKVRWSYLDLSSVDAGQYNDFTLGFNWYWSDRTRMMFDWIMPFTDSNARFGSSVSDLIGMRLDFNW